MVKVKKVGSSVTLHYELKDENGLVVESTKLGEDINPISLVTGLNSVIPGFEDSIIDMTVGESKEFEVLPKDGYGEYDETLLEKVNKSVIPDGVVIGDVLQNMFNTVMVKEINGDEVTLDANHPMSGKILKFKVDILDVVDLSEEEFNSFKSDLENPFNVMSDDMDLENFEINDPVDEQLGKFDSDILNGE